jgi:prevent-host-death family protein
MKTRREETDMIDISTAELRKSMGEILNRVQYGGSRFVVKRKGKEIGAIVPVELARELERILKRQRSAREQLLQMMDEREGLSKDVPEDEIMEEAVRETRTVRGTKK